MASTWVSNLGDGIALAAGPLLVASLTDSPLLIALGATLQWLPPLLLGLVAGVVTDRVDRTRLVIAVDAVRCLVIAVLALAIVTDRLSVALVLVLLFLLGTAEVFADNASSTLLPGLVARDDLAIGNARLMTGFITLNQLVGPPLGAALFVAGAVWPFAAQIVLVAAAAVLISRIALPRAAAARTRTGVRGEIGEGLRWTWRNPAVRTLVLTIFIFNITFGAAWALTVLYATERLGLGAVGFGLVTTTQAVGGLLGALAYGWITRRVSLGNLMRIGLVVETLTHAALAWTTVPWIALTIYFAFGVHTSVWGATSTTVRQRAVPDPLRGRVGSVNMIGVFGGLVLGSAIGGLIAQQHGVVAAFWFAFAGSAAFVVLIWRQLAHIAHVDQNPPVEPEDVSSGG